MLFSDSILQYYPESDRSTGAYIVFLQGGTIEHCTNVPGQVYQFSTGGDYNAAHTAGMALANFRMIKNEFMKKDPDVIPK